MQVDPHGIGRNVRVDRTFGRCVHKAHAVSYLGEKVFADRCEVLNR